MCIGFRVSQRQAALPFIKGRNSVTACTASEHVLVASQYGLAWKRDVIIHAALQLVHAVHSYLVEFNDVINRSAKRHTHGSSAQKTCHHLPAAVTGACWLRPERLHTLGAALLNQLHLSIWEAANDSCG
jgi:hypothetical protein